MDVKQIVTQLWCSPRWGEVLRFGIVGVVATLIQYGTYYLLNQCVGWGANASITIGYMVSVVCNFFLSNYFTFKTRPTFKKGVGFALSHCLNYVLQILFLNLYIGWGISESWAPLPMFATVVPINFLLVRLVLKSQS
jgi:putative flippase GtrA